MPAMFNSRPDQDLVLGVVYRSRTRTKTLLSSNILVEPMLPLVSNPLLKWTHGLKFCTVSRVTLSTRTVATRNDFILDMHSLSPSPRNLNFRFHT